MATDLMVTKEPQTGNAEALSSARIARLLLLLAIGLALLAYIGTLRFHFVYDDLPQISNPQLRSWHSTAQFFNEHVWSHVTPGSPGNYYRPIFLLWMLANFQMFGTNPIGWHAMVLLVHLLVTGLVYLVAARHLQDKVAAGFAALIFAVHPVHVESVAWVSGITEPLMALFFIGSLLCYLRWRDEDGARWFLYSAVLFAAAVLVKETAIVLPAMIFAYEWAGRAGSSSPETHSRVTVVQRAWRALLVSLPYGVLAAAYLAIRAHVLKGWAPLQANTAPLPYVAATWPALLWFYLRKLVWPWSLGPFYDLGFVRRPEFLAFVLPVLVLIAIAAALRAWARRDDRVPIACGWFLVPLLPAVLGTVRLEAGELVHDRYLYLPSVGFAMLVAMGLRRLRLGKRRLFELPAAQVVAMLAITCTLAAVTATYSVNWATDLLLFSRSVQVAPGSSQALTHLANEMDKRRQHQVALNLYQKAVDRAPDDFRARMAYGLTLMNDHEYAAAEPQLLKASEINPREPLAFFTLGLVQGSEGKHAEAEAAFRRAAALSPNLPRVHFGLASILEKEGKLAEARDQYKEELRIDPNSNARQKLDELDRTSSTSK